MPRFRIRVTRRVLSKHALLPKSGEGKARSEGSSAALDCRVQECHSISTRRIYKVNSANSWFEKGLVLALAAFCVVFVPSYKAQVQTTTGITKGEATKEVTVEHAEVLLVEGNDLFLKMEDGSIRHIVNVPERDKIEAQGRHLSIHELKQGMRLQHTI